MIEIISHRGLWSNPDDKNTALSFETSLNNKFGIETDVREYSGKIVISHDIPNDSKHLIDLDQFFDLYKSFSSNETLAINIKSDGLFHILKNKIHQYGISNYFVFDMSIPETLNYKNQNLNFFSRQSEFETYPIFYDDCDGIWLDQFYKDWVEEEVLSLHDSNNKKICIVSPELHGRDHLSAWEKYKNINKKNTHLNFIICTDYPLEARSFFE